MEITVTEAKDSTPKAQAKAPAVHDSVFRSEVKGRDLNKAEGAEKVPHLHLSIERLPTGHGLDPAQFSLLTA